MPSARPWFLREYQPEKTRAMWARRSICASPYLLDKHGEKIRTPAGNALLRTRVVELKPGEEKNKEKTGKPDKPTFNIPISSELESEMDMVWNKRQDLLATRDESIYAEDRTLDLELWNLIRTTLYHLASKKSQRPIGECCLREWPTKVKNRWMLIKKNEEAGRRWSVGWEGAEEVTGPDGCKLSILQRGDDGPDESDGSEGLDDEGDEDEEDTRPDNNVEREDSQDPIHMDSEYAEYLREIPDALPTHKYRDRDMLIAWVEGRLKGPELKKFDAISTELFWKNAEKQDVVVFLRRIMGLVQMSLDFLRPVEALPLAPEVERNVTRSINTGIAVMEALGRMFDVDGLGSLAMPTAGIVDPLRSRRQKFKSRKMAPNVSPRKPTQSQRSAPSRHNMKLRGVSQPVSTLTGSQSDIGSVSTIKRKRSEEDGKGPAKRQFMGSNLSSDESDKTDVISNLKAWNDRLKKLVNEKASRDEGLSWVSDFLYDVHVSNVYLAYAVSEDDFFELMNDAVYMGILPVESGTDLLSALEKFFPKEEL